MITQRPWGQFEIHMHTDKYWLKTITVNPDHRLSLQSHEHRKELWLVISGEGLVDIDGHRREVTKDAMVTIYPKKQHRIKNIGKEPLVFIEIATGKCDEADIERYEDDYGRKK